MKLSYRWLGEYVDIGDIDPHELSHRLTMCTSEIEAVEEVGSDLEGVVVGKILEVKPHPDADHLLLTKVDVGKEILPIVSGEGNPSHRERGTQHRSRYSCACSPCRGEAPRRDESQTGEAQGSGVPGRRLFGAGARRERRSQRALAARR